jgi:endonuclease III
MKKTDKYPEYREMIEAMDRNGVDYERDLRSVMKNVRRRAAGERFSLSEHLEGIVFSLLSSQRPWEPIEQNREKINAIFKDFDVEYIKNINPDVIVDQIKAIKCGNRGIRAQMYGLKDDIDLLEKIADEYGSVDAFYDTKSVGELTELLSNSKSPYKMKGMGVALAALYLKNMGILTEKPDTHTRRIIGQWGYSVNSPKEATIEETHRVCKEIAEAYGLSVVEVDLMIWKAGESRVAYQK